MFRIVEPIIQRVLDTVRMIRTLIASLRGRSISRISFRLNSSLGVSFDPNPTNYDSVNSSQDSEIFSSMNARLTSNINSSMDSQQDSSLLII